MLRDIVCPISYNTVTHTPLMELLGLNQPKNINVGSANMTLKTLKLSWGEATSAETKIYVDASIYNPNNYPIIIKRGKLHDGDERHQNGRRDGV